MDKGKAPLPFQDDGASSSNSPAPADMTQPSATGAPSLPSVRFPESPAPSDSPSAAAVGGTGGLKSAFAKKGGGWGKFKMANKMSGGMTAAVEELREEAKRNMKMRRAAIKKMEMRNKMFETGGVEYDAMEYLPELNRRDGNLSRAMGDTDGKKLTGEEQQLRNKQYKIYAAMRGKLPTQQEPAQRGRNSEDLTYDGKEELDDIQVEVALEQKAKIENKDGKLVKTYKGLEDGVSKVMGEMKKDILGRTVRPWKNLSKEERWWVVTGWMYIALDFVLSIFFFYLAFFLFKDDKQMDPLAWQLTFGVTAVFTGFHLLTILFEFIDYYEVFLILNCVLIVGLTYGAINYFLSIYLGEFNCFNNKLEIYAFGICYEGRLLVSIFISLVALISAQLYQWRWRIFKRLQLKRRGEYTEMLDLEELMTQIDAKFDKYREMEPEAEKYLLDSYATNMAMRSHAQRKHAAMGIFDRTSSRSSSASTTGSTKKPGFATRLLSMKPGQKQHMTSTELRGNSHVKGTESQLIQVKPAGSGSSTSSEDIRATSSFKGGSFKGGSMKRNVTLGEHNDLFEEEQEDHDMQRIMNASAQFASLRRGWNAGITTGTMSPKRQLEAPNASPTMRIEVASPGGRSSSGSFGQSSGPMSPAAMETEATAALHEKREIEEKRRRGLSRARSMTKIVAKNKPKTLNKKKVHP